jgi:protein tyrosine/serine phosphatase
MAVAMPRPRLLSWIVRPLKIAGVSVFLFAASVGSYWGILQYEGNFHTVAAGQFYRSAQPSSSDLRVAAHEYGIKSILNLRGTHRGEAWYDDEVAAATELGMAHYDYPLSATTFVTGQQIGKLLTIIRSAPKPMLVHCKSGADRTGFVSALYRYAQGGEAPAEADKELSLIYGHFPYLTSRSVAMDNSFWAYVHHHADAAAGATHRVANN